MKLKIKKLHEKAVIPAYATDGAAGFDLVAIDKNIVIKDGISYVEYRTGLAFEIPKGNVGLIFPRSSISNKTTMVLSNSVGVIDSDYRGEVTFRFKFVQSGFNKDYAIGERIGQMLLVQLPEVTIEEATELSETKRGEGGYGSTGN